MPQPVSLITTRIFPFASSAVTVTVSPSLVYFRALSMILTNTCRRRLMSPSTGGSKGGSSYTRNLPSAFARSVNRYTASPSSARISILSIISVMRPFCMREKSKSSSTMPESRSDSRIMTPMPRSYVSRSASSMPCSVSAQPLIAVSGVRSSCDTEEIKSFFIFSAVPSSTAILLMVSHSSPISSFWRF